MSPEAPPRLGGRLVVRGLLGGLLILALTSAAVASAVLLQVDDIKQKGFGQVAPAPFKAGVIDAPEPGEPQTLLLVGTDRRFGEGRAKARSDTLMLVRLDPKRDATAVLNIPRDLVVTIPGRGLAKINEAYALGGLSLVTQTVKATLGLSKVHHAMAINFKGFRDVVDKLGCIYTDVDRHYFNDRGGPFGYATIDVNEGYQRLCGRRALEYVRYRHGDSDFVRASRQQTFLRNAKDQVGTSALIDHAGDLIKIFGSATQADPSLQKNKQVLRLLEQGVLSAGKPVRQIRFPGEVVEDKAEGGLGSYVAASADALERTRVRFLRATRGTPRVVRPKVIRQGAKRKRSSRTTIEDFGLVDARRQGEDVIAPLVARDAVRFPMYYPRALTRRARWTGSPPKPRVYTISDRSGHPHGAYRLVFTQDELNGDYYGVQGTSWKRPPILARGAERLRMRGRVYRLFYDGKKLRVVAWRTKSATYWVSNTLGLALTNTEMLGLARSLTRVGR